jgi:hypothetical protein
LTSSSELFFFSKTNIFIYVNGKCLLREPCATSTELGEFDDPFEAKWYNCKYEDEPKTLDDKNSIDLFKKLCSPMYTDDNMKLCCSPNQLIILKKDIATAEAVIGGCSSCFLNFRIFWCHLACDPNQADFIIPIEYQHIDYNNFTQVLHNYEKSKHDNSDNTNEPEEHDPKLKRRNAEEENAGEANDEAESNNAVHEEPDNAENEKHDTEHEKQDTPSTPKTNNQESRKKVDAVTKIEYYLSEDYLMGFIESCRLVFNLDIL